MTPLRSTLAILALAACGGSIEDNIDQLSSGGDDLERAKQELLLAKDQSLEALLEAFDDPHRGASRPELAEVLVGLSLRLESERLDSSLRDHLLLDPDPEVRRRIN